MEATMPDFDRTAAVDRAASLARQGRLSEAIGEYGRIVAHMPDDWNSANVLGDLLVRAGETERAVGQFSQVAAYLAREGFAAKARAMYQKVLRLQPDHELALRRTDELRQYDHRAETTQFLKRVADA